MFLYAYSQTAGDRWQWRKCWVLNVSFERTVIRRRLFLPVRLLCLFYYAPLRVFKVLKREGGSKLERERDWKRRDSKTFPIFVEELFDFLRLSFNPLPHEADTNIYLPAFILVSTPLLHYIYSRRISYFLSTVCYAEAPCCIMDEEGSDGPWGIPAGQFFSHSSTLFFCKTLFCQNIQCNILGKCWNRRKTYGKGK